MTSCLLPVSKLITDTYWSHIALFLCVIPLITPPHHHTHTHTPTVKDFSPPVCPAWITAMAFSLLSLPSAFGSHFCTWDIESPSTTSLAVTYPLETGKETAQAPRYALSQFFWGGGGRKGELRGLGLSCRFSEAFSLGIQTYFLALRNQESSYTKVFHASERERQVYIVRIMAAASDTLILSKNEIRNRTCA